MRSTRNGTKEGLRKTTLAMIRRVAFLQRKNSTGEEFGASMCPIVCDMLTGVQTIECDEESPDFIEKVSLKHLSAFFQVRGMKTQDTWKCPFVS